MINREYLQILGKGGRDIHIDITYLENHQCSEVVIFSHGFKGFKDWGAFNLMAYEFVKRGCAFVKLNFSHNGVSGSRGQDIIDLDAFSANKLTIELDELHLVIAFVKDFFLDKFASRVKLSLLGHSRGGGLSLLAGVENPLIKKIVTMGSVATFHRPEYDTAGFISKWKREGFLHIKNKRTLQDLPVSFDFYRDYIDHSDRLNIADHISKTYKPILIIHGQEDEVVSFDEARQLYNTANRASLLPLPGVGHAFGAAHPWQEDRLPIPMKEVVQKASEFILEESLN